jgi:hypothetical protein
VLTQQNSLDEEEDYDVVEADDDAFIEEDLKCEEEHNGPPYGFPIQPFVRNTSPVQHQSRLDLSVGLKSPLEVYGFDWDRQLSEADMTKYRKYAQLSEPNAEIKNIQNDGSLHSFSKLKPIFEFIPSFYTVDNVFNVSLSTLFFLINSVIM